MQRSSSNNYNGQCGQRHVPVGLRKVQQGHANVVLWNFGCHDTRGVIKQCQFFVLVCDGVEKIVQMINGFLLELHRATCKLLHPQPLGAKDLKPLPDLLMDLPTSKMTLCNSGPDVVPKSTGRPLDIQSNRRRRVCDRPLVHPLSDLNSDHHKTDNRHYYHHGHPHQHHHSSHSHDGNHQHHQNNNDDNNNINTYNNISYDQVDHDQVDGPPNAGEHGLISDIQHNNIGQFRGSDLIIPRISVEPEVHSQPIISANVVTSGGHDDHEESGKAHGSSHHVDGHHDNNNNNNRGDILAEQGGHLSRRLLVPDVQRQHRHPSSRSPSPRPLSRDRSPNGRRADSAQREADHEITKDIVLALRTIGDNLDAKIKHHQEPSVQAVFGSTKIKVGQLLLLALRQHNLLGVAFGASLELLVQFNRL